MKETETSLPFPLIPKVNEKYKRLMQEIGVYISSLPNALPSNPFPLEHSFAEGLYIRTVVIPKGYFLVGELHKESYFNTLLMGDITMVTEAGLKRLKGPATIVSQKGTQRFGYSHTEVIWVTVHANPDNCMDIKVLEERIHEPQLKDIKVSKETIDLVTTFVSLSLARTSCFDKIKFKELTLECFSHEKPGFWSDWTVEQQRLYLSKDWEAFSKSRGYVEEEINKVKSWIEMYEIGIKEGFNPFECIKEITALATLKNLALDKKGEILKSSNIPMGGGIK